jgi:hypothetical protein
VVFQGKTSVFTTSVAMNAITCPVLASAEPVSTPLPSRKIMIADGLIVWAIYSHQKSRIQVVFSLIENKTTGAVWMALPVYYRLHIF